MPDQNAELVKAMKALLALSCMFTAGAIGYLIGTWYAWS